MQPIYHLGILALACGAGGIIATAGAIAEPTPAINCQNPASNVEYKYCARLAYEASDRELNQVYRRITGKMANDERKVLTTAQLAWIRFRDANCNAEVYQSRGGTGYGGFLSNCLERVTRARTTELQQQFENR